MKEDRASYTAVLVAYCVLVLGGDAYGRSQLPPGIVAAQVAVLLAAGLPFGRCPYLLCNPVIAKFARCLFWFVYPLFFEGIGFRKLIIDSQVRDFLRLTKAKSQSNGARQQVVIVAAGYDTLALRLCTEFPEVGFFEVDHPATSAVKEKVWNNSSPDKKDDGRLLKDKPVNITLVKADLTKKHLDSVLKGEEEYDSSAPTIVVVEGLSMYLTEKQMRGLFGDVAELVCTGSMVVFDFFGWNEKRQEVEVGSLSSLHRYGFTGDAEPWIWGLEPRRLNDFFADTDWVLSSQVQSCGFENVAALELCSS